MTNWKEWDLWLTDCENLEKAESRYVFATSLKQAQVLIRTMGAPAKISLDDFEPETAAEFLMWYTSQNLRLPKFEIRAKDPDVMMELYSMVQGLEGWNDSSIKRDAGNSC